MRVEHKRDSIFRSACFGALALAMAAITACAEGGVAMQPAKPMAAAPQPGDADLQAGLAVKYWSFDGDKVADLERLMRQVTGSPGAPLPGLAYKESTGSNVLTLASRILIGADITGFIRFPQGGRYAIAANSNDGVRVYVGGKRVTEDPDAHPMQRSPVGEINVEGNTWYPLRVVYFQRQGAWGLELLWAPAGQALAVVPADALHQPR
jgi:hypothetical protein